MQATLVTDRALGRVMVCTMLVIAVVASGALAGESMRRPANYLVVTPSEFAGSAPLVQFMDAKAAQGYTMWTYEVPSGTSNNEIKSYIEELYAGENRPKYVLLVGDTSGSTSTATTIPHFIGGGSRSATTDLPYACMPGGIEWYPDVCVGRFSVVSVEQLQNVVDKSLFVEAGSFSDPEYVKRGAFLANPSTYGMAEPAHDYVIDTYFTPNGYTGIKLYASEGAGTADVTAAVNNGCLWTVYYGHSSSGGWWNPAFDQGDIQGLSNEGLYGLACGWSCNTAHFSYDECAGETWLRVANRGAAAYISASDYIYWGSVEAWEPSTIHERSFFASFFVQDIWEVGPAWRTGLYTFLKDHGGWNGDHDSLPPSHVDVIRNFFEEFVLLGDPALLLPQPDGFALVSDVEAHEVCSPPVTEVVYTIDVDQLGDFSEDVTLSCSGEPAGATVSFDINDLPPPFTSQLTVSDLDLVVAGEYSMVISGVAGTKTRSTVVTLSVATEVPAVVTLVSPPDGEVDQARRPTLSWDPSPQASEYDLEVAGDPGFVSVAYTASVSGSSHTVSTDLETSEQYYWRVRAGNGCGISAYSEPFSFTTVDQPDYFSEQFNGESVDLEGFTVIYTPDGSGDYYSVCGGEAAEFAVDPSGGTTVDPGEDGCSLAYLSGGATVSVYGQEFGSFYVCDNGYITFTGADGDYTESLPDHFGMTRLSPLFNDLSIPAGGTISWQQLEDRAVATYVDVPEWSSSNSNTFQVEMFFDGTIRYTWLEIDSTSAVVGISAGDGMPGDFIESDLSSAGPCPGDLDGDGDVDLDDHAVFEACVAGPGYPVAPGGCAPTEFFGADLDGDSDVDLADFGLFAELCTGQ